MNASCAASGKNCSHNQKVVRGQLIRVRTTSEKDLHIARSQPGLLLISWTPRIRRTFWHHPISSPTEGGLRWSHFVGQIGGLAKVYSDC
jgi:hypothetical protein